MAQYTRNPPLVDGDLGPDPMAAFAEWLSAAQAAEMMEPAAMTLATVSADGRPHARIVLLKGYSGGGLRFFTDYEGDKGQQLLHNPQAALVFWWDRLERQVRFEGRVERLSREESRDYFYSRPRASQLSAYSSHQSHPVAHREILDQRYDENARRYAETEVPLPDRWGGYRLIPDLVEFWQGRGGRLHDRLRYRRAGSTWISERLEP